MLGGMTKAGRRPGNADTRAEIITAARAAFHELGYEKASIRGIAKRAGVDPALVHHYFADKSDLFVQTMHLPHDPHRIQTETTGAGAGGVGVSGERLVERFLAQWEQGSGGGASFVAMVQAVAASPRTAATMREFLEERITLMGNDEDDERRRRRRALVSSQLVGLGWVRYVMGLDPVASADRAEVARWVGPTIDRYINGELPPEDAPGD